LIDWPDCAFPIFESDKFVLQLLIFADRVRRLDPLQSESKNFRQEFPSRETEA